MAKGNAGSSAGRRQAMPAGAGGQAPPSMAQVDAQQCGNGPPRAPASWPAADGLAGASAANTTTRGPLAVQRMTLAPFPDTPADAAGAGAPNAAEATSDWKTSNAAASHATARRVAADGLVNVTGVCIPMVATSLRRPPEGRNFNLTRYNCYAPRFQHLKSQHTMGLEQLAAIRELLVKQAPEEAASKKKPARPAANEAGSRKPSARPSDDAAAARKKPARSPAGERREAPAVDPVLIAISRLQRQFPKAFPKKPAPKVPLKLGVLEDLVQHAKALQLSADEIKQAVKTWCDGRRYWDCMVEAAARVDLNGEPAGAVTANEAQHAKRMASRRHAKAGGRGGKGNANKGKPAAEGAQQPAQVEAAAPAATSVDATVDTSVDTSVATPAQAPSDTQTAG